MNNTERLQRTVDRLTERYPTWCGKAVDLLGYSFKPLIIYQPGRGYWLRKTPFTQDFLGRTHALASNRLEAEADRLKAEAQKATA